jgi:hypothetical protein
MERVFGPNDADTVMNKHNLGLTLQTQGRLEEAVDVLADAHTGIHICFGARHGVTVQSAENLCKVLQTLGRLQEAEPFARHVLACRRAAPAAETNPNSRELFEAVNMLGLLLFEQERYAEAEPLLRQAVAWKHAVSCPMDGVLSAHTMGSLLQSKVSHATLSLT